MEFVASLLQIMFFFFLVRSVFALVSTIVLTKKLRDAYDKNEKVKKSEYEAIKQAVEANSPQATEELVQDKICGKYIPKVKAYITMGDNKRHYFCSWECRQRYIEG
jgi:YHS domain-containing protein